MRNWIYTAALLVALQAALPHSAEAAKRRNKPWFSGRAASQVRVVKTRSVPRRTPSVPVARSIIESPKPSPTGQKIAQQALQYKGTKYRFGGMTSRGVDCSGLVSRVWEDLNLKKVPRASSALYQAGSPVGLSDLRAGDLVFFKNTYKRGISHVGVYAGKNKFIHAPGERKRVSITRLSDPYYQLHYAGARRLY